MMAKCGIGSGKCDEECAEVSVEEHVACQCDCTLTENLCKRDSHHFNSDMCTCECKDIIGKRECLNQGKIWDENSCKCGCPAFLSCSIGTAFSNTTCACKVVVKVILTKNIEDNRIPRSYYGTSMITWDMVVIGILLGIIIILLMIIFIYDYNEF
jgi:hypothetical protein